MTCRCRAHRHEGEGPCEFTRKYGALVAHCTCPDALTAGQHRAIRLAWDHQLEHQDRDLLKALGEAIDSIVPCPGFGDPPGSEALRKARELVDAVPPGCVRDPEGMARLVATVIDGEPEPPDLPPAPTEKEPALPIHYASQFHIGVSAKTLCGELAGPFRRTCIATGVTCPKCLEIIGRTDPKPPTPPPPKRIA